MHDVFVCVYARTPIVRFGGVLVSIRADDLGVMPLNALMKRNAGVDWTVIGDVIFSLAKPAGTIAAFLQRAARKASRAQLFASPKAETAFGRDHGPMTRRSAGDLSTPREGAIGGSIP